MINKKNKYIWENGQWPHFIWNESKILGPLSKARKIQGKMLALASFVGIESQANLFVEDALKTSAIEGEKLDVHSLRSSVAKRLGLPTVGVLQSERKIDGLVEMLLDATVNYKKNLDSKRLKGWQAGLFPTGYSGIHEIKVGNWRESMEPMRVVSGAMGKEKIHFEAPPAKKIPKEIDQFLKWFNSTSELDGLIRAAIAHLWFITIHPFDDGNGRVARAITDLALAQDEGIAKRCYSLSSQISKSRKEYYEILEKTQKGDLDITEWILWFLELMIQALESSLEIIKKAQLIGEFWENLSEIEINTRQKKVLQKMLEQEPKGFEGGMTNKKYVSITKTSRETAKRDLADLEEKGIIKRNPGMGRSISYSLNWVIQIY
jgi:Fic family protein